MIGGGVAGLSCACELAEAGMQVTLLEAANRLGGRAYSFVESNTGLEIDNCQHVILGCCEAITGFLARIGSLELFEFAEAVEFVDTNGERLTVKASRLPAPLHLLPSVLTSAYLPAGDKLRLIQVMVRVAAGHPGDEPASDYLSRLGCSKSLADRLIAPILESALNERPHEASAKYARMVLLRSLMGDRGSCRLGIARAPLSRVIEEPAARYLDSYGAELRLGARVTTLDRDGREIKSLTLATGDRVEADLYVCAVRPKELQRMGYDVPQAAQGHHAARPIVAAHLFLNCEAPEFCQACLPGEPFGWVFNKSRDSGLDRCYVQGVASAAADILRLSRSDIISLALRAATRAAPELAGVPVNHAVITRDMRATFPTCAEWEVRRPESATSIPNLFLAGDWTSTGWPGTLESAAISGHLAARAALESAALCPRGGPVARASG